MIVGMYLELLSMLAVVLFTASNTSLYEVRLMQKLNPYVDDTIHKGVEIYNIIVKNICSWV